MKRAAFFLSLASIGLALEPARAASAPLKTAPLRLVVALVEDPDFPPLDEKLVQKALKYAEAQFGERFGVDPPSFDVQYRYSVARFLDTYAVPTDPQCRALYAARYKGGGLAELVPQKARAIAFLEKSLMNSLNRANIHASSRF